MEEKQLSPLEIINLMGHEPRKIITHKKDLALKNNPIPWDMDILHQFKMGGIDVFTYRGKVY